MEKMRNKNIDLIKSIASFFVILVHFFLNTGFYNLKTINNIVTVSFILKNIAVVCVPLFLLVTGYLMNEKKVSKKYYFNILISILTYLFISLLCLFIRKYFLGENASIRDLAIGIFTFETNQYAWYVNMYLGLYLLIPFLNIIIEKIKENKNLFIFIIVILTFLTAFPKGLTYWSLLYPINYYFIGAYVKKYNVNTYKLKYIIVIVIVSIIEIIISKKIGHNAGFFNNYGMILILIKSISVFFLLNSIKFKRNISLLKKISKHTLSIYLISYMVDIIGYKYFNSTFLTYDQRFFHGYIVLIIFIICLILAIVIDYIMHYAIKKLEEILNI